MATRTATYRPTLNTTRVGALLACLVVAIAAGVVTGITGSPIPALAILVLALGALLLAHPEIGTIVFLGLLWTNAAAVAARFHGVPDIVASAALLGLLSIPVTRHLLRREAVVVTPALFAILAFLAANLVSAAFSTNINLALTNIVTLFGEGLLIYLLISNALRTPQMIRAATWAIIIAAVGLSALSVHQELTGSYRDPYLGFAQTTRLEDAPTEEPRPDSRPRMMGPIGEQNRYAQILLVVLPLALFAVRPQRPFWRHAVPIGGSLVILAGIFLTFSRGAAVALGILMLVVVLWRYVRFSHMLAIVLAAALTVFAIAPEYIGRLDSIRAVTSLLSGQGSGPDNAILGRTTSNIAALLVFLDHPVTGVGPGVYVDDYSREYANELGLRHFTTSRRAHNMYLEWGADLGILGLSAGVAMIAIPLIQLARLRRYWQLRRPEYATLAGAYSLAIIAYMASAIFLHLSYVRYFFALLAIASAVIWVLSRERSAIDSKEQAALARASQG
jgi:putative inorganic carbon (hco3(-)) transporter